MLCRFLLPLNDPASKTTVIWRWRSTCFLHCWNLTWSQEQRVFSHFNGGSWVEHHYHWDVIAIVILFLQKCWRTNVPQKLETKSALLENNLKPLSYGSLGPPPSTLLEPPVLQRQIHHWAIQNSDPHLGYFPHNGVFRHSLLQATLFVAKGNGPKTPSIHPSGHRLVFLFEKKRQLFISMSCLENSQDFWIPIGNRAIPAAMRQLCNILIGQKFPHAIAGQYEVAWTIFQFLRGEKKSLKLSQFQPVEDRSDNGLLQLENLRLSDDTVAFVPGRICQ